MGIVLGALGGLGEAAIGVGARMQTADLALRNDAARNDMETQRQKTLEEFKKTLAINTADTLRNDQVARVDAAAGKIADTAVASKRGIVEGGIVDKEAWTPEQQAAVDQSLGNDRAAIVADGRTREKAATLTGDISPEKAAVIDREERRLDIVDKTASEKAKYEERKDATLRYIAELKDETAQKRIEALLSKTGSDKNGTREALSFIDGVRKDLASEASNLKAMYQADTKDLSSTKRDAVKAQYEPRFAAIEAKRAQIEKDFNALRDKVGLPTIASEPAATPKPAASAASTGKAPYPDGTRLTGPGGAPYIVRGGKPVPE